jgi:hypothetical protein
VSLHNLFGWHIANLRTSHWEVGYFITNCKICGAEMIKLPGLPWRVRDKQD